MTNDQNIVRGRHLDSLAADAKRFTLEQNLALNQAIQAELAELDTGGGEVFTGATSSTGGLSGLVPAPQAGDESKFLRGDGTWSGEIILPTVASIVDGGFWLDVSGTPPAPKFYYDGTTYTFGGISALAPDYPYFWNTYIFKVYNNASGNRIGAERIDIPGGYEITIPASMLTWNYSEQEFQEGMYIDCRLQIKRTSDEIDLLTQDQITLSGYAPTNYFTQYSKSIKPQVQLQWSPTAVNVGILSFYTSQASYTEAQSAGSFTLTINNPKYGKIPLKINWGLAAGELMTAT